MTEADAVSICQAPNAALHACMQCRKVKMKCQKLAQDTRCVRCTRKSLQCDFLGHRRGRKHGFKLQKSGSKVQDSDKARSCHNGSAPIPPAVSLELSQHLDHGVDVLDDSNALTETHGIQRPTARSPHRSQSAQDSGEGFWMENRGFRLSDILNQQITRGAFCLQNVLSTEHGHAPENCTQDISDDDPIKKGFVNLHVATELFDGFMKHLNPFVSQLDPSLHTFRYVREKSSFLFTTVLAVTAKLLHSALCRPLLSQAEELFLNCFRFGSKSPEIIQAILILTYWKEPRDNRAWLSVGHAIRMAIELGWHQLGSDEMKPPEHMSDLQAMQFRNMERTWLVLFVYDRSISSQTGKPWMIERSSYLESVSNWHLHRLEVVNDRLLCAFVSLRLITSAHFEMMTTQYAQHQRQEPSLFRSLLRVLDREITDWQKRWIETVSSRGEGCHAFLIPFYGSYARLLLFTSSLRASIRVKDIETSVDTELIWNSFSSALDMLKLVSGPSSAQLVYFAQDSVHVMIAYATVFLIKLLLSAPSYIRVEMEMPALESIRDTAKVFDKLQAPAGTSCALQAAFLHNVLVQHEAMRKQRTPSGPHLSAELVPTVHTATDPSAPTHTQIRQRRDVNPAHGDRNNNQHAPQHLPAFDTNFMDDESWISMFANAGFNIDQGAFMSPT